jgi:prepilin-type N-terminal cleavage/methylation domain-containing protein
MARNQSIEISGNTISNVHGMTLVELLTVIAIMGILLSIATINFHDWQIKANVDRQTNEMLADIHATRLKAVHTKKRQGVLITSGSYLLKNYSSDNEALSGGVVQKAVTLKYAIAPDSGSFLADPYVFDVRGLLYNSLGVTIKTTPAGTGANDCIVLSVGRTNMGKMANGSCGF